MSIKEKHYTISNGEVQLAVSETGQGQTLLFFNGGGATQVSWKRLVHELREPYRVVTFDFRNHGKTTRSSHVSFKGFLSDAEVIMDQVAGDRPLDSRACTRHILSSGWITPTSFRSKNQQLSHDLSTRLPKAFGLTLPPNRKPAAIIGCPRSKNTVNGGK